MFRSMLISSLAVLLLTGCNLTVKPLREAKGSLEGTVLLSGLEAHEGIEVEISGPMKVQVQTNDRGSYEAQDLLSGTYTVIARAESVKEAFTLATVIVPPEGGAVLVPQLSLTPVGTLGGRVLLASGSGAGGVEVVVRTTGDVTTTDEQGRFSFQDVRIGVHQVLAAMPGYSTATSENLRISRGEHTLVDDLQLTSVSDVHSGRITGSVSLAGEAEHGGALIVAMGPTSASAISSADGSYELYGLQPGTYEVIVSARSTQEGLHTWVVEVGEQTAAEVPLAVFQPLGRIRGQVVLHQLPAAEFGEVAREGSEENPNPFPVNHGGVLVTAGEGSRAVHAETFADGTFELPLLSTGPQTVRFRKYGHDTPVVNATVKWNAMADTGLVNLCQAGQVWRSEECVGDILAAYALEVTETYEVSRYEQPTQVFMPRVPGRLQGIEVSVASGEYFEAEDDVEISITEDSGYEGWSISRKIRVGELPREPAPLKMAKGGLYFDFSDDWFWLYPGQLYKLSIRSPQQERRCLLPEGKCEGRGDECSADWQCTHQPDLRVGIAPDNFPAGSAQLWYPGPGGPYDIAFKAYVAPESLQQPH